MKASVTTELGIMYQEDGKERLSKQRMTNVVENPAEEDILALGDVFDNLAPQSAAVVSVVETVATEYVK
ncbi:hypothetical protein [Enterococcus mediterraneensis]|uniref:DUF1659 domain-containing protein n=1 Tax=Enterococcus mediterraneensis TaxID=2364791 RepID=UPI000F06DD31|nr:hypothetical protein [Enterococcus mediterraneensis]